HREAVTQPPKPEVPEQLSAFLATHCKQCHSGEKPKGDFAIDPLAADLNDRAARDRWSAVLAQLKSGTMPPRAKPRPPEKELKAAIAAVAAADAALRAANGRAVIRRL